MDLERFTLRPFDGCDEQQALAKSRERAEHEVHELRRISLLEAMKASRLPNLAQVRDALIFLLGDGK
jgi:hypothetical protein